MINYQINVMQLLGELVNVVPSGAHTKYAREQSK